MKSQVFRIIAWGLAVGVVAMWYLQGGTVTDYQNQLAAKNAALEANRTKIEFVQSEAKKEKDVFLKDCESLENQDRVVTEELKKLKDELAALDQTIEDEKGNLEAIKANSTDLPDKLTTLQETLKQAQNDIEPLREDNATIEDERANLDKQLADLQTVNGDLQAKLNALRADRAAIQENYDKRSRILFNQIEKPPWLYYGDKTQIKVMNVRPSMTGVFLDMGMQDGVKPGMEFLVRRLNPPTPTMRSWRFKVTQIFQDDYCFAVIMPDFGDQDIRLQADEEVQLERSGNLAKRKLDEDNPPQDGL